MRTVAIVPVKRFERAKQRLAAGVDPDARNELAEAMLADVLAALALVDGLAAVVVVSAEPRVAALAHETEAEAIDDPDEAGQSPAAARGVARALDLGADRALLVPGDCPALDPREVTALLARHAATPGVVVVPDRHGTGTNALLLSPPDAIDPAFGPDSCARHRTLAAEAGAALSVDPVPSLGLDVDTPADLRELVDRGAALGRTAEALGELGSRAVPGR
jgi:2-phospho-L-lactate guanylyltransferase